MAGVIYHQLVCAGRSQPFTSERKKRYCSLACRDLYQRRVVLGQKPAHRKPVVTCKVCGKEYRRRADNKGYCSRACAFADAKAWVSVTRRERTKAPFTSVFFRSCAWCDRKFVTRYKRQQTCCSACGYEQNKRQARERYSLLPKATYKRTCKECGEAFQSHNGRARYCSKRCMKKRDRNHRDRAKRAGVHYEYVNVFKVFDRDGWMCQVCGKRTPKSRRGTQHANAPELGHRIAIASGGPHNYDNVQCECRACNALKGAKYSTGQLPLFALPRKPRPVSTAKAFQAMLREMRFAEYVVTNVVLDLRAFPTGGGAKS